MSQAVFSRAWTLPKDGNTTEQNEDAWRLEPFVQGTWRDGIQMTLADGTTEAVYSGLWARTLVAAAHPDWPVLSPAEWERQIEVVKRRFAPLDKDSAVPWYVRNKFLSQGSQATLLTATLSAEPGLPGRILRALAVGDCCLFLFRPQAQAFAFPLVESGQFGQNPDLITSRAQASLNVQRCEALVQPGDLLLACSDALARWMLQAAETNAVDKVFEMLQALLAKDCQGTRRAFVPQGDWRGWKHWLKSVRTWLRPSEGASEQSSGAPLPADEFAEFIAKERAADNQPRLRNDDTTLILCQPLDPSVDRSVTIQEAINDLRQQFATATTTVRPLHEAGIPERSRRWLLPWNLQEAVS